MLSREEAEAVAVELEAWAWSDYTAPFLKWKLLERAEQLREEADKNGLVQGGRRPRDAREGD